MDGSSARLPWGQSHSYTHLVIQLRMFGLKWPESHNLHLVLAVAIWSRGFILQSLPLLHKTSFILQQAIVGFFTWWTQGNALEDRNWSCEVLVSLGLEFSQGHLCNTLLVKVNHKANPDSGNGEVDSLFWWEKISSTIKYGHAIQGWYRLFWPLLTASLP